MLEVSKGIRKVRTSIRTAHRPLADVASDVTIRGREQAAQPLLVLSKLNRPMTEMKLAKRFLPRGRRVPSHFNWNPTSWGRHLHDAWSPLHAVSAFLTRASCASNALIRGTRSTAVSGVCKNQKVACIIQLHCDDSPRFPAQP
jgi:hypothetical protein